MQVILNLTKPMSDTFAEIHNAAVAGTLTPELLAAHGIAEPARVRVGDSVIVLFYDDGGTISLVK